MNKTQHPSNTRVLGAPKGWDQAALECGGLAVTETTINGAPCMVSYWKPTEAEIANILAGGLVALWIIGTNHPPVALGVEPA